MRGTQRKSTRQQQSFITVQRREIDKSGSMFAVPGVSHSEVVHLPGLCCEVGSGSLVPLAHNHRFLPTRAEVMFAGIDRKVQVGIAMSRSHPAAIESRPSRRPGPRTEIRIVLDENHQRLSRVGLRERVLGFVCRHIVF